MAEGHPKKNPIPFIQTVSLSEAQQGEIERETPETKFLERENRAIREAIVLMLLSPLEREIFSLRFNFFDMGRHSPTEIAKIVKRSIPDVKDILQGATNKIVNHHESALADLERKTYIRNVTANKK
ncbi:MAG TPA: hypothetical protein VMA75_03755 [Candidatus Paceibacterota bacterium]|nr:hypothetical protein [Candidatus Paceibacterota bacterium]